MLSKDVPDCTINGPAVLAIQGSECVSELKYSSIFLEN